MVGARFARRRSCRPSRRAGSAGMRQPRTLDDISQVPPNAAESSGDHRSRHHRRVDCRSDRGRELMAGPLIDIKSLRVLFHGDDGRTTHAVDSVDLSVANGATLGLVGESGCGKSVTSLAIMGLLPKRSAEVSGAIRFDGFDLLTADDDTLRDLRGNRVAMIFQEPMTSLNPSFTIGDQIVETILRHRGGSRRSARERAIGLLRRGGISFPGKRSGTK